MLTDTLKKISPWTFVTSLTVMLLQPMTRVSDLYLSLAQMETEKLRAVNLAKLYIN